LLTRTPEINAPSVAPNAHLVMTFNEEVRKGTGKILIQRTDDSSTIHEIDVTSGNVQIRKNVVLISPPSVLDPTTQFRITIPAGVFTDTAGNDFAGIPGTDAASWTFRTAELVWTQRGQDIDGEAAHDWSGWSVSVSADGNTVAIGAIHNDGADGSDTGRGHTRIFRWNADNSNWAQLGGDLDGEAVGDNAGYSVSLSADGNTVAIGAPFNEGGPVAGRGHTRIYRFNSETKKWDQLGVDIDGEAIADWSGWSVSVSADGNTVAIGAAYNGERITGQNTRRGHTRIYRWNDTVWDQLGVDIDGEAPENQSGNSVSLSANGNTVAIGARYNDGNSKLGCPTCNAGHVRVYRFENADVPAELNQLRSLSLDAAVPRNDQSLPALPDSLVTLSLANQGLTDVSALANLNQLEVVDLAGNSIRNVDQLLGQTIADNEFFDSRYTENGSGWVGGEHPTAFEGDYRILPATQPESSATYTLTGLAAGSYDLLATWPEHSSRTTQARYQIQVNGQNVGDPVEVNQRLAPDQQNDSQLLPGSSLGGNAWVTLQNVLVLSTDNAEVSVIVTGGADGNLALDGLRLERAVLPVLQYLDLTNNPLDNRSRDIIL
ncbi:MAG: Ig-like domain-containing protein, partial [Planctomycetaceae bacterium]